MTTRAPRAAPSSFEPQRDRSVVHKLDVHHRAEFAGLNAESCLAESPHKLLVQWNRHFRPRGVDEAWTTALPCVAVQRELRHDQHAAANVREGKIHLVFRVG